MSGETSSSPSGGDRLLARSISKLRMDDVAIEPRCDPNYDAFRKAPSPASSATMFQPMPQTNTIARLINRLRNYFRDVHQSREDLTGSISQENVLPPIPPADGKRLK